MIQISSNETFSEKRGENSKYREISYEQVCVLIARDRAKATTSKVAWRVYKTYAKEKGLRELPN